MASFLIKTSGATLLGMYAESRAGLSEKTSLSLFGITPLILSGVSFYSLMYGFFAVGGARQKYREQAIKDGEPDAEDRYSLPNLYVDGNSKNARAFNAVQRSHQHIFETLPGVMLTSIINAFQYPCLTAVYTATYALGRVLLTSSYGKSEGEVAKRYENPLARSMWYGILGNFLLAFVSCANMITGKKVLW
ncbi:hypothetical protein MPSEU_000266800 [Mayamaea pseudoterrestris]|nr:hypothetical protein MPSEU_000266800 [Mayamaea pseudoterrestris]